MVKNKKYFLILLFLINIFLLINGSNHIFAQSSEQYFAFIKKGEVNYFLPNFTSPFELIDESIIPANCKLVTGQNGYLEIHNSNTLLRIIPNTSLEIVNNNINLINGTMYINTLTPIKITINKNPMTIHPGIIIINFNKYILINFVSDCKIEYNEQSINPTKTERIFKIENNNIEKSKEKLPLNQFDFFNNEIKNKIKFINELIDIFFERIFYYIDKNNTFVSIIENTEKKFSELQAKTNNELKTLKESSNNPVEALKKYGEIYQLVEGEILYYNFIKYHYLEFYFQMRNYFEYYKRLIQYSNHIYDLNLFNEFPDYSSKSSFMIVYDKIKSFTETVKLAYEVLEITYINMLDSNSTINKQFLKFESLKENIKQESGNLIKEIFSNLPKDINNIIIQTFFTQVQCKTSTTVYINRLYDILLLLNNEYSEDEKIINKFFSLDDIIYKSLFLQQAQDVKEELDNNFKTLDRNIIILRYLMTNSNIIKDSKLQNILSTILEFYPSYNDDYLSVLSIIDEIEKSYKRYLNLLRFYLKVSEGSYYQNLFAKEIDKYLVYFAFIQNEIMKLKSQENVDTIYISSLIDIQDKLISITYLMYDILKNKYKTIQFPKKLYVDQQKEYNQKLKEEINNINLNKNLLSENELIKKLLIIRVVVLNQILEDFNIFNESIKDYEFQKSNLQKSILLFNLSLSEKNSFDPNNFTTNSYIIWKSETLLLEMDKFFKIFNKFKVNLSQFFEDMQGYYLQDKFETKDIIEIKEKTDKIEKSYNDFLINYFSIMDKIYEFNSEILSIQSNTTNINVINIINELNTFIFLYKSKLDSIKYFLSVLRVIFSINR